MEAALDTYETYTSWTPTWDLSGSGGGFTSVGGSGFNQGFYMQIGKQVFAQFRIQLASGFTTDAGTFSMVLPVPAYISWGGTVIQSSLGSWQIRDDSTFFHYAGTIGLFNSGGTACSFGGAYDSGGPADRERVDENTPMGWDVSDVFSGQLSYRAA